MARISAGDTYHWITSQHCTWTQHNGTQDRELKKYATKNNNAHTYTFSDLDLTHRIFIQNAKSSIYSITFSI